MCGVPLYVGLCMNLLCEGEIVSVPVLCVFVCMLGWGKELERILLYRIFLEITESWDYLQ